MKEDKNEGLVTAEQLRSQLQHADQQKENLFSEKKECDRRIAELLQKVKTLKQSRDEKTGLVKQFKEQRKKLADTLREKINNVKQLPKFRSKNKQSPHSIKEKIDKLEIMIETEVFSFEKEKKTYCSG